MLKKSILSLGMTLILALAAFQSVTAFAGHGAQCQAACDETYVACVLECEAQGPNPPCVLTCELEAFWCYEACR